jgi:hypothetical protein
LLSTAWSLREMRSKEDPWNQTVLALAAARCEGLSPSAVMLHRFGLRAWGGIVLAVAFVGTLAGLSSTSLQAGLARPSENATSAVAAAKKSAPLMQIDAGSGRPPRRIEQSPTDTVASANSPDVLSPSDNAETNPTPRPMDREASSEQTGSGTGSSQAQSPTPPRANASEITSLPKTSSTSPSPGSRIATGSGRSSTEPIPGASGAEGVVQASEAHLPPWRRSSWPAAVESADGAVRSGRVADNYRDLVRGYFDPNQR